VAWRQAITLEAGQQLLYYRLITKLGEGGMGVVWKAEDTRLNRIVAIKVLRPQLSDDARNRERFEREARAISNVNHPHICTLHDIGRDGDIDFLVMEYLDGEVLSDRLKHGALPLDRALVHGVEIAEALHEAHRLGIVHRDLKPGNLILARQGIKLTDFGLATIMAPVMTTETTSPNTVAEHRLTATGSVIGTVPYMAPEQLEGRAADPRTDVFALGCVLHEMVTGQPAFSGTSQAALMSAIMSVDPPPVSALQPAAPASLDHAIGRCLAKDPDERWHSTRDLARELGWIATRDRGGRGHPESRHQAPAIDYRIEYFKSGDGASIAAARGGSGPPLLVVPTMADTIETSWPFYAGAFGDRELITYDRRGSGLSERGSAIGSVELLLQDAQAVIAGFGLREFDVLGTLLGTTEAAWIASLGTHPIRRLVLRAPTLGLKDWASIPGVRAALAAMEHDWEFFTESFAQFVVGWGNPNGSQLAERFRRITSRDELRNLLHTFMQLDLVPLYSEIRVRTLVEHHPGYFFPDTYSRRIASLIPGCRMAVFSGAAHEFLGDHSIARTFLRGE
jgi:pimeloyl-ACP methyl ester carboxylesterase/predicted Ser/Thr protein kinase